MTDRPNGNRTQYNDRGRKAKGGGKRKAKTPAAGDAEAIYPLLAEERVLLGCMMQAAAEPDGGADRLAKVEATGFAPAMLTDPQRRLIAEAMFELARRGRCWDAVELHRLTLERGGDKSLVPDEVVACAESGTIPHVAPNHAETLVQHRRREGLAARAHDLAKQAAATTEPSELARLGGELAEAATATGDSPIPTTDLGNAERFASQQADRARHDWSAGRWLVWSGTHWRPDAGGGVHELAAQTVRAIYGEASRATDDDRRRELGKWAAESEDRRRIAAMLELAKPKLAVTADKLDADPYLFNCKSGTLDLRTGELRPHRRDDLLTICSPTSHDPDATPERWLRFLDEIFDRDAELIAFVQRMLGMMLTGDIREQHLFIAHGSGANGKSVLLDTVAEIMGEYAGQAAPDLLVESKHREHPTELADLQGRRMVVASETEGTATLRMQLVKRLTGDGAIKARRMRQDYYEFQRTHKLVLQTNNKPVVKEDSEAVWRRIRLIPFAVTIPPERRDPKLLEKLRAEQGGILAWLVAGCMEWQRQGLLPPSAVLGATAEYRDESDPIRDFIEDCCELDPDARTPVAELRAAYERHCDANGARPLGKNRFADALGRHGCHAVRNWQGRLWQGVALVENQTMTTHVDPPRISAQNARDYSPTGESRHGSSWSSNGDTEVRQ